MLQKPVCKMDNIQSGISISEAHMCERLRHPAETLSPVPNQDRKKRRKFSFFPQMNGLTGKVLE